MLLFSKGILIAVEMCCVQLETWPLEVSGKIGVRGKLQHKVIVLCVTCKLAFGDFPFL